MKSVYIVFWVSFVLGTVSGLHATEKLWIPLGTPVGQTVDAIEGPVDSKGVSTLMVNPNPQPVGTAVPGIEVKDGFWTYPYLDGHPESEGNYTLGKKEGVWKYYWPSGDECREMEFKDDVITGNVVLWAPDGSQQYYDNLTTVIQNVVPPSFKATVLLPYWIDLQGDGNHELLVIARSDTSSMVLVLDSTGNLLDSKTFDGLVDDFIFETIKTGGPVCFGYDIGCDAQLGVCQWEFDILNGNHLKSVLQYQGWYKKDTPITMPVFKEIPGQVQILTDNGNFGWNPKEQSFDKISN